MVEKLYKAHWVSIIIGVLGGLSAIVTMFVNVSDKISIKWLLFSVFISLVIITVLIDSIRNNSQNEKMKLFEIPLKYVDESEVFVIRKNELFSNNAVVNGYLVRDEVESLLLVGYVIHSQENILQIKIEYVFQDSIDIRTITSDLSRIRFRPITTFNELTQVIKLAKESQA